MKRAQRFLLVLSTTTFQVMATQMVAPVPPPLPATVQPARPVPPTRPANGPGAPNWTVLGAQSGPAGLRAAAGMNAPVDHNGDFLIGPEYVPAPELVVHDIPEGAVRQFTMESKDSKFYRGIARDAFGSVDPNNPKTLIVATHAKPWQRAITVYIPAQYQNGTKAPFIVVHDGPKLGEPDMTLPHVLDNLIDQRRVPTMIAVMIQNGGGDAQGSERGLEYDTLSGKFAEFIESEVLPQVEAHFHVALTRNPDGRAAMGCSSGAAAAFTMAWFHPEWYHRIVSYSGTFVNQQWPFNPRNPGGAWDYHAMLVPNTKLKPIRIWMLVGDQDLFNPNVMRDDMHDWVAANHRMAAAFKNKGYPYQYTFALDSGHCDRKVREQTLPEALEWVWRGYETQHAMTGRQLTQPDERAGCRARPLTWCSDLESAIAGIRLSAPQFSPPTDASWARNLQCCKRPIDIWLDPRLCKEIPTPLQLHCAPLHNIGPARIAVRLQ